jgi:hypothetical protein
MQYVWPGGAVYDEELRAFGLKSSQHSLLVALTRNLAVMLKHGWIEEAPGIELIQLRLRSVVMREASGTLHLADDRIKRAVGMLW